MKPPYLCIDSNNFVQCCIRQLDNKDTIEALDKLLEQMDSDKVTLLLPEIVKIEVPKVLKREMPATEDKIRKFKDTIKSSEVPENFSNYLCEAVDTRLTEIKDSFEKAQEKINKIFGHRNTKLIPLTGEILVESFRIYVSGQKPIFKNLKVSETAQSEKKKKEEEARERDKGAIQTDAAILASLKLFLTKENPAEYNFYLCSNDLDAFAKDPTQTDQKLIHSEIKAHFPKIEFFTNLGELLNEKFASEIDPKIVQTLEPIIESSSVVGSAEKKETSAEGSSILKTL